ncbi:MAG: SCO family protein [Actinomycetota bacterium]|nr:SCO family protein [Actinomycetota bacterium]
MSRGLQLHNPLVVSAFHRALVDRFLVVLAVAALLALLWSAVAAVRRRSIRRVVLNEGAGQRAELGADLGAELGAGLGAVRGAGPGAAALTAVEPPGRRFVRGAFGLLWILDGLLQAQSAMPLGLPAGVVRPAAAGSPGWVLHLVSVGTTVWGNHPVEAAASVVWIQVAIGVALLVAPRGRWSRTAGVVSVGWGLVVWVFGEAFGGLFAPGAQWAFGFPGAALFYVVAGGLVALPERWWRGPRLGRVVTGALGIFFLGMALLQAWPGRGTWRGGRSAPIAVMAAAMARTSQPRVLSRWVAAFGSFDGAHGWAVNLFLVVALGLLGVALVTGRRRVVLAGAGAAVLLLLADWVLVQDLGLLGGLGTDPNSMVPTLLLLAGGLLALLRPPVEVREPVFLSVRGLAETPAPRRWELLAPGVVARTAGFVLTVAVGLVGVIPMAVAGASPNASPIVTEALNGVPGQVDAPAPPFSLVDQSGSAVSLAGLRGKAVALTFLDPVCTRTCPLIAQTFRRADVLLGARAAKVELVAIVANPVYRSVATVDAFDRQEGLNGVGNWRYLTGSERQLAAVWKAYGIEVDVAPAGAMVNHSEIVFVIGPQGRMRAVLNSDPGVTQSARSSMATLISDELRAVMAR